MTPEQRKQLLKRCSNDLGIRFFKGEQKTVVHTHGLRIVIEYEDKHDSGSGNITAVTILRPQFAASLQFDDKLGQIIDPILIKWAKDVAKNSIEEGDSILEHIDEIENDKPEIRESSITKQENNDDTSKD